MASTATPESSTDDLLAELGLDPEAVLHDYRVGRESREASLLARREVLTGKAKFGIFGDGKEVPQLAMARAFEPGDIRAGYYRDQTVMMALGLLTVQEFFAQLYAHTDLEAEPASAGRQMNGHFATRFLEPDGSWKDLTAGPQSAADLSPTGSQMPKLVGLAYASRLYREVESLAEGFERFSDDGNEVAFGTIGNASCAEGMFWESINAVGVLRGPLVLSIWDDDYGISVPNQYQITKQDLGELLSGFRRKGRSLEGYRVEKVRGWDYAALVEEYRRAAGIARSRHVPSILHVHELTQPQGHSTSGSHERYKSPERLEWEREHDCLVRMREWILEHELASAEELDAIETRAKETVREAQRAAWRAYREPLDAERDEVVGLLGRLASAVGDASGDLQALSTRLEKRQNVLRRDLHAAAKEALVVVAGDGGEARRALAAWLDEGREEAEGLYASNLYADDSPDASGRSALDVETVEARFDDEPETVNGFEVLNACFDAALERHPNLFVFGEDVGKLGDVNQACAGLQDRYGELRVADTGIRETTIIGQAIGMALRGLRPIAEIQYLDYLLYALQILSDDVATMRWRTRGGQMAPVLVRTRGHRLEGVWHSGSPMAGILGLTRGMWLCVPRDMTRAAGMYNTLLQADDPAIVIEVLNGYRVKEALPANIGELTVPLGRPEVLRSGDDVTVVTYGACCRIVLEAAELLERAGVSIEVIDVQTLLPFDLDGRIVESLRKTNRVVFVDEDVPGGATAHMLREVLEVQGGFWHLDSEPRTLTAHPHRPAYGSDGDYFSKPNREDVFMAVYGLMREADPRRFPRLFEP